MMKNLVGQITASCSKLELSEEGRRALAEIWVNLGICVLSLIVPTVVLYLAMYALVKKKIRVFEKLSWLSVAAFLLSSWTVVIECSAVRSLQLFGVAIGSMKAMDLYARRRSPPKYIYAEHPSDAVLALIYLTELRYESFEPNHVRRGPSPRTPDNSLANDPVPEPPKSQTNARAKPKPKKPRFQWPKIKLDFSEPVDLVIHGALFWFLQVRFSQSDPMVVACEILLAIYLLWESLQLVLRYRTSPPLFGPIYKASSLSSFWGDTWHSAFASPCRSLAYGPLRHGLRPYGVHENYARGIGIFASFALMGAFHVYALAPLLPIDALARIYVFFLMNGAGIVIEDGLWGRYEHWVKALLAWVFELNVATWTVEGMSVPRGLQNIEWSSVCDVKKGS